MKHHADYYFSPQSPWTYLGHGRFSRLVAETGASVKLLPVDLGQVFPVSGGLPLGKRAPQRQAYRLVELKRFSEHLGVPINLQPKFFPVASDDASRLIIAVEMKDGAEAAMRLSAAIFGTVWVDEGNIADEKTLAALLAREGLPAARLEESHGRAAQERYEANTRAAIDAGVFGAPSYVVDGEMFWGQDRLDFVERKLRAG